jgi:hypothetical protein
MGGFSKFGILQDSNISSAMPEFFGDPPEIVGGVLVREAEKAWRNCNPLVWGSSDIAAALGATRPQTPACTDRARCARIASTGVRLRT